jgi:hypothetical protein
MLRIAVSVAACPLSASRNAAIAQKVHRIGDGVCAVRTSDRQLLIRECGKKHSRSLSPQKLVNKQHCDRSHQAVIAEEVPPVVLEPT